MKAQVARLSRNGQVTLPRAIRQHLGIKPGDVIRFLIEDGVVKLRAYPTDIEAVFGSVKARAGSRTVAQVLSEARTAARDEPGASTSTGGSWHG